MELVRVGRAARLTALLAAGCVGTPSTEVRSSFSAMFECSSDQVQVQPRSGGYAVSGCQRVAFYKCDEAGYCQLGSEPKGDGNTDADSKARTLRLWLPGNVTELVMSANPEQRDDVDLSVEGGTVPGCQLGLMIDGERLDATAGKLKTQLVLHQDEMMGLGGAMHVVLRQCQTRWVLGKEELQSLRKFVFEYREELAWKEEPSKGGPSDRNPPKGGWQAWKPNANFPAAAQAELSGTQLFEKLSPSVVRVEGKLDSGYTQGSAVAVTPTSVITNCHVLQKAQEITVKQGAKSWPAKLIASEPKRDRCVLAVAGAEFTPVAGVRAYADLKVGESLYTLGNPSGLDLTLANGILSSLREDEGVRFVQTTAPISPGSSGGGLFDARGNLVGITTLSYVGKERLNQSLNFAIAAEMFWTP